MNQNIRFRILKQHFFQKRTKIAKNARMEMQ